jgi:flagellin-like protein
MIMKGISSLIATVLLIAFVVAIAGIISMWSTSLTSTQTKEIGNQSKGQTVCTMAIVIDDVEVPSFGSGQYLNVTYHNVGDQSISGVYIDIRNSSAINSTKATSLGPGDIAFVSIGGQSNKTDLVRVRGVCASSIVVSDECAPSDLCWKYG